MKLTLKGCEHKSVEIWGSTVAGGIPVTCVHCYERFLLSSRAGGGGAHNYKPALPPGPCAHSTRKPVAAEITKHMRYRDAVCTQCGVIQRHPDGRGVWTDVLFYGFVIREEP